MDDIVKSYEKAVSQLEDAVDIIKEVMDELTYPNMLEKERNGNNEKVCL